MVNIEQYFNETSYFHHVKIDRILFDANYPVLFSMEQDDKEYLVCCPVFDSTKIVWIVSEIELFCIIDLLKDKITIRDAFVQEKGSKFLIEVKNKSVKCDLLQSEFPDYYLPTEGEFMEAEDGEFDDDIKYYESKSQSKK